MKHVTILVPKGGILGSIEGPRQLLSGANSYAVSQDKPPLFKVQLAGLSNQTPLVNGTYFINTEQTINDIAKTDLIIIPAFDGDKEKAIEENAGFIPWIVKQYGLGAEVASLCMGAFLLASSGLITGKKCATHWMAANEFRKMFPNVNLVADKVITDEHGIYSSGGAYSYLNLVLYIIEKYAGRAAAIFCAKMFQIDIERDSQSPFIMFSGQKDHEDEPIRKAQEFIEGNFQERITVDNHSKGSFDIVVTDGANHKVRVEAEENLQEFIEVNVNGNNLIIQGKKGVNFRATKPITVYVTAPALQAIKLSGSGNVKSDNTLTGSDRFEAKSSGSGNMSLDVETTSLQAAISGSGNIMHLDHDTLKIRVRRHHLRQRQHQGKRDAIR